MLWSQGLDWLLPAYNQQRFHHIYITYYIHNNYGSGCVMVL